MRTRYRLHATWRIAAPPDRVRAALRDVAGYSTWWRSVVGVGGQRDGDGWLRIRGALPYAITTRLTRLRDDERVLGACMRGDLEGWCAWRLDAVPGGTLVRFRQHVAARSPLLRALSPMLHGLLAANHAHVMRVGERGLRRHLAHGIEARSDEPIADG